MLQNINIVMIINRTLLKEVFGKIGLFLKIGKIGLFEI